MADAPAADPAAEAALEKIKPLLRPDKVQEARIVLTRTMSKFHSGPIPSAEELEHLEQVLPGAANRCFEMAEREQAHRHKCESEVIRHEFSFRGRGQWLALSGLILLLSIVGYLAYQGDTKSAAALGAATIVGVVTAFTASKYIESKGEQDPTAAPVQSPEREERKSLPRNQKGGKRR